jgi:hypothetical protein
MPSSALAEISQNIENLDTDSLGKFYMYAAVLEMITVRDPRHKNPFTLLPQDTKITSSLFNRFVGQAVDLNVPHWSTDKNKKVESYINQYAYTPSASDNQSALEDFVNTVLVLKKLTLAYFRKGQLGDLNFINERMLDHLTMLSPECTFGKNKDLYNNIRFKEKKVIIEDILTKTKAVHDNGFAVIDSGFKCLSFALLAIVGVVFVASLTHVLLGLVMISAGVFGACLAFSIAQACFSRMDHLIDDCQETPETIINTAVSDGLTNDTSTIDFIIKPIIVPLMFSGVTIAEQLDMDGTGPARKALADKTSQFLRS